MEIIQTKDFDFVNCNEDTYALVMAYNREEKSWDQVELCDIEEDEDFTYSQFFFMNSLPTPEPESPTEKVKEKVNELIGWIQNWSVRAPAVDDQLSIFRTEIFEILDEVAV